MIEYATTFDCIGVNDPPGRFNRCRLAPQIEITERFGDPGETFTDALHRCTCNHFIPYLAV